MKLSRCPHTRSDRWRTALSEKLPPMPKQRPTHALDYLLAPEIARTGQVSRHCEATTVHPPDTSGWVRVTATTDDLFGAVQLLLG